MRGAMGRMGLIGYLGLALMPLGLWAGSLALSWSWAGAMMLAVMAVLGWALTLIPGRAGRFSLRAAACGALMVLVAAGSYFAPLGLHWAYRLALGVAAALALLFFVRAGADRGAFFQHGMIAGLTLYAVSGVAMYFVNRPEMNGALLAMGAAFLAATGVVMNGQSLRTGAAREGARPSSALRAGSRPWLIVMGLAVVALAFFDRLRDGAKQAALWLVMMVGRVIMWLSSLMMTTEQNGQPAAGDQGMLPLPEGEASPFWTALEKVFLVLAILGAAVLVVFLFIKLWKVLKRLFALASERMRRLYEGIGEAYVDEKVSLYGVEDVKRALRERAERLRKLVTREPRWAALDGRGKVRRLVRDLMRASGEDLSARTVRESTAEMKLGRADPERLSALYERARYSDEAVSDAEAEALRREVNP